MSWFSKLVSRVTQPEQYPGQTRGLAYLPMRKSGIVITEDKALELGACFACIRVISSDIAKLPWHIFATSGESRRKLQNTSVGYLLNTRPNPDTGAFAFRETMVAWALSYGNGYAEIERDRAGRIIALWQVAPDRVEVKRDESNRLFYRVRNTLGDYTDVEPRDMFHLHGLGFDGLVGYSTIAYAAQSIGFGLAAEQHGSAYFGNSAIMGIVLEHPMKLGDVAYDRLKESLRSFKGSGAFEPFIAEEGMKINVPSTKQSDAQFVETQQQIVENICRWFRVPPQKVMNLKDAHYNNVEHMNIAYATDTLGEWIKRLEEEADYKLISNRNQANYTKINVRALMRGDHASQAAWYKEMLLNGVYSINEVREFEDADPIPDGDQHLVQAQMTPIDRIGEMPESEPEQSITEEMLQEGVSGYVRRWVEYDIKEASKSTDVDFNNWIDKHHRTNTARYKLSAKPIVNQLAIALSKEADVDWFVDLYKQIMRDGLYAWLYQDKALVVDEIVRTLRLGYEDSMQKQAG